MQCVEAVTMAPSGMHCSRAVIIASRRCRVTGDGRLGGSTDDALPYPYLPPRLRRRCHQSAASASTTYRHCVRRPCTAHHPPPHHRHDLPDKHRHVGRAAARPPRPARQRRVALGRDGSYHCPPYAHAAPAKTSARVEHRQATREPRRPVCALGQQCAGVLARLLWPTTTRVSWL